MSYLSLFTFFMLILITSDNLLQMFFGWEGVGLASYLLIGFWYHKKSANNAAIKAFIVNRIGDFGFLLGIVGIFFIFDTVYFDEIFSKVYFSPIHKSKLYEIAEINNELKMTDLISSQVLTLPMYPNMTDEEKTYIVDSMAEFFENNSINE